MAVHGTIPSIPGLADFRPLTDIDAACFVMLGLHPANHKHSWARRATSQERPASADEVTR
jgi:hypothetical protein